MLKKVQVVMLPTNQKANALWWSGQKLYNKPPEDPSRGELNHLYFLSDETIKEGDWIYNKEREPSIIRCIGKGSLRGWLKIIATTDSSLSLCIDSEHEYEPCTCKKLPQPSQDFIKVYVEEYNKGIVIKWVDVKYTDGICLDCDWNNDMCPNAPDCLESKLKVNSKNEITFSFSDKVY